MSLSNIDLESMGKWDGEAIAKAKAAEAKVSNSAERNEIKDAFKRLFDEADTNNNKFLC